MIYLAINHQLFLDGRTKSSELIFERGRDNQEKRRWKLDMRKSGVTEVKSKIDMHVSSRKAFRKSRKGIMDILLLAKLLCKVKICQWSLGMRTGSGQPENAPP